MIVNGPGGPDVFRLIAALKEVVSFEAEDTKCLMGDGCADEYGLDQEYEQLECPDGRCKDHGCMVARVNRWRALIARVEEG